MSPLSWFLALLLNSVALLAADYLVPGFEIKGFLNAILAALVLGLVNTLVRPVIFILTLPITIFSLGIFIFFINAFAFTIASWLVPGFTVYSFWGAFWGAIITSAVSWLLNAILTRR